MNIGSGMLLDRTIQPKVRDIEHLAVQMPQRCTMPNGVSLNVLDSGDNEVVRIDLLMEGGRWQQSQPLQALFTNRMLREGTLRYSAGEIAEKLDYYGAWLELSSASEYAYVTLYSLYNPQIQISAESETKRSIFREKDKTKRSKKESAQHSKSRNKSFVMTSVSAL